MAVADPAKLAREPSNAVIDEPKYHEPKYQSPSISLDAVVGVDYGTLHTSLGSTSRFRP